jgi:hypothetical protein
MYVFIATPCYTHRPHFQYTISLTLSFAALLRDGINVSMYIQPGQSLVVTARSLLLTEFLKTKATDLVWIDDDISWQPPDLVRLVRHDVDVVGAAYRMKSKEIKFSIEPLEGAVRNRHGLLEMKRIGTGLLRIKRHVIETLIQKCPHLRYRDPFGGPDRFALFNTGIRNGELVSEDYAFCDLWREHGGKVWCDTEISATHWDGAVPYTGKITAPHPPRT